MPRTILAVDDDPVVLEGLQEGLEMLGFDVTTARDGSEALVELPKQHFEVVVVDILMPVRDGFQLIGDLQRFYPGTAIVAISGGGHLGPDSYLATARRLGANLTLAKPFSFSELEAAVNAVMAHI